METVNIKGGEIIHTEGNRTAYEVVSGEVLAYIVPVKGGEPGRRLYLGSFMAGSRIPGFQHSSDIYGCFEIVLGTVGEAELLVLPGQTDDRLLYAFAARTRLPMPGKKSPDTGETGKLSENVYEQFEEALIEKYNRNEVKQDGYIYAAIREKEYTREQTLRTVLNAFSRHGVYKGFQIRETGNALYDAVAVLCQAEKIDLSPLEKIEESNGRRFDIHDMARVSRFAVRQVALEERWFRHDCGSFLAFAGDRKHPVALLPKGPSRYVLFDPKRGTYEKVTREMAETLMPTAYMLYRPFPDRAISAGDLVSFGLQKVYSSDIVRLVMMSVFGVLIGMLIPYINEQAYDRFIPLGDAPGFIRLSGLLLACALGGLSFSIVKNLSVFRSLNTMKYAVQSAVFDRLFKLPESFYREYDAAMLGIRAMEVTNIFSVLASGLVNTALSVLFSLLYLFQMFSYAADMALSALILMAGVIAIVSWIGLMHRKVLRTMPVEMGEEDSAMFQFVKGISKLRMAGAEDRALDRYMDKLVRSTQFSGAGKKLHNVIKALTAGLPTVFSMVFYWLAGRHNTGLSIGAFSAFCASFGAFSAAAFTLLESCLDLNEIRISYGYARPILETLPEISDDVGMPEELTGEIEISSITFAYDKTQEPVLKDLSLHVKPGEYVGIVGPSGCGKSTLLKLLLGFEKPQIGRIYYDNQELDGLDKRELRKKLGVVLQDGGLISGSIYENITITSPGVKKERVEETVRDVGLEEDIRNMPMGLHTIVSEEAETISGGQKQRILIARAMAARPKIIFLDEATSALDNAAQAQVVETLERLQATKVVIAHRLSTVVNCDRIIVMDHGSIKEEGTYKELMARKGMFYELAIRQIS
ncbi:MAG: NHLP bacteriocin export ABC transporter permease/ATPase subunit [Lachnospiraceae bacterium]|nr:NHLP bacteriocin export ABC transporter permease/ATPase subunit [Lachnospiraceae bacterium]